MSLDRAECANMWITVIGILGKSLPLIQSEGPGWVEGAQLLGCLSGGEQVQGISQVSTLVSETLGDLGPASKVLTL